MAVYTTLVDRVAAERPIICRHPDSSHVVRRFLSINRGMVGPQGATVQLAVVMSQVVILEPGA